MAKTFNLPDLGEGMQEAEIVNWHVKEGDTIKVDEPLLSVETDKAVVDVPSPYTGKVTKLHWAEGDVVPTHSALAEFAVNGDESDDAPAQNATDKEASAKKQPAKTEKPAKKAATGGGTVSFNLPDLGEGMQEAEIVNWHVKEGDTIKVDEPLLSVETDKAVVDVPSPHTGKVTKLHYAAGDVVPTGSALADFEVEGAAGDEAPKDGNKKEEPISEDSGTVVGKMATSDEELQETVVIRKGQKKDRKPAKRSPNKSSETKTATQANKPAPAEPGMKPKALPSVRVYAQEQGVELADCNASGKNGVITREDVDQASQSGTRQPAAASGGAAFGGWDIPAPRSDVEFGKAQPLRGPRRAMHASMSKSRSEVAECTLFDDADIHGWMPGQDITARIIRAVAVGCRVEPVLNAWYNGEKQERTLHKHVDLAMAVDTPEGLIVPVLRQVDTKDGAALRDDLNTIKQKTHDRSVSPADMKNPTITLSNFGMMAGRYATPLVVPPQVAILGTGGLRHDVVAVMGGVETHKRIPLSITFDHRCITGGEACRWLAAVIKDLQKPF